MQIELIVCMAANRVIGLNGTMPWHLKEDLQHFKALTLGKPVLMGRRTFASIGRPLPKRRNLVLTSHPLDVAGIEVVSSIAKAQELCVNSETLMIIGGQQLYSAALPQAQVLHITRLQRDFAGDTYFPEFSHLPFKLVAKEEHYQPSLDLAYTFETWLLTSI